MNLLELPEEILLHFCSFLSLKQLHWLCVVCKDLNRVGRDYSLDWTGKFLDLAQTEMDKQAYGQAIVLLNRLLVYNPACSVGHKQRGLCWDHEEEPERAVEDFTKAVERATDEAQRHRFKSYLHLSLHDFNAAYKEVQLALELSPGDPTNYHQHAYVLFKLSNSLGRSSQKQEMKDYKRVLELGYDRLAIIYNNIGYVYYERGHFSEALTNFNRSIELCPYHVRAYYNRSTVWEELREWPKAIADYNAILSINPEVYDAYYFRSKCHSRMGSKDDALSDCLFSLMNNRSHIPSLTQIYNLFLEDSNIDKLSQELDTFEVTCKQEYNILKQIAVDDSCIEKLAKEFPGFKHLFSYGKAKRSRQKEKFSQVLCKLYTCRGLLRLVNSDIVGAKSDYNDRKEHTTDDMADCFFTHSMEDIDFAELQPSSLAICKEMLRVGSTRRRLRAFIQSLDTKLPKTGFNVFPNTADQMYFLACYSFRRLRLYRSTNGDVVVTFWQILNKNEESYKGLQVACADPFTLTLLFEAFLNHGLLFTSSFLNSFQEILNGGEKATPHLSPKFFTDCRQLVVSHTTALNRGNGD